jgi:hypothetical protein
MDGRNERKLKEGMKEGDSDILSRREVRQDGVWQIALVGTRPTCKREHLNKSKNVNMIYYEVRVLNPASIDLFLQHVILWFHTKKN